MAFFNWIKKLFGGAWRTLLEYLRIAIPEVTAALLNDLLQIADPIVTNLSNQNLTGEQKRQQAVTLIQGQVAKAGIDVGISLIHAAVELAVQKQKALAAQQGSN